MSHKLDSKNKYVVNDEIGSIHEYDIDTKCSHIYLSGSWEYITAGEVEGEPGVEFLMSAKFIKNMNILMRLNPNKPILIHMKTCGGDWTEGMAIHNMIKSCPNPVVILNYTHARSMSSLIFQAANKRVMMPDSYFMFHDGTYATSGTVKQVESDLAFSARTKVRMLDIYIEQMKRNGKFKDKSEKWIRNWLRQKMDKKEDVFLTAEEAVELGLADSVFGTNGKWDWGSLIEFTQEELERG